MASATFANVSSRPAAWTLGQPSSALPVEAVVDSTAFTSTESNSTGFTSSGFTSAGFQKLSNSFTDKDGLSSVDSTLLQDAGMIRSIVKIESRFENTQTGHSIWKIGTGWLIRPDLIVTGGDVVYDAEYQLGAATQVKCFIGYHASGSSEIQPRYGQRVVTSSEWIDGSEKRSRDIAFIQVAEPFAIKGCTCKALEQVRFPEPEAVPKAPIQEEPTVSESKENVTTTTGYYSSATGACGETDVAQVQQPKPQPEVIQTEVIQPAVIQPEVIQPEEPKLKIPSVPVPARTDVDGFVNVTSAEANNLMSSAADTATDPFYEVLKTVARIDAKTLDIESPLVDDIGQFVSVTAGSLLRYVVGAGPISTGEKTKLPGVSERALLAEASLQAVLAIEESPELNEIVEHMRQSWSANAPDVDQVATLIVPYLKERAQHIAEYHLEDSNEQSMGSKKLKRRHLAIRLSPEHGESKDFAKGLFAPTIPLAGREQVFSSLGPVLRDAILAVETLVSESSKAAINDRVPKLLEKSLVVNSTQSDLEAARILIQRAIMADAAYQALASLSEHKLQALKLLPLGSTTIEHESIFDFIKTIIQMTGPVALHPTKQAVKKFIPLLIDAPSKQPEPTTSVTTKTTVHRLALRDVLRKDEASANVGHS
ncbi:hypothetical protein N0V84_004310 [Fusarium piperis]|uniref:Uncharacterized protein n=1 Tax=Fusarium piperis TaxID=1435070 RepID=A0A9W9BQ08_9HYPO|nr:hypothetical protein N0V84_004310 [Fusarium piperis]